MSTIHYPSKADGNVPELSSNDGGDTCGVSATWVSAKDVKRTKAAIYAEAERRMQHGKHLVIGGFVVATAGMIAYCLAGLAAGTDTVLATTMLASPGWSVGPALAVIGIGMLLWLFGSFLYLLGGMDSDPEGPDVYF